MANERSASGSTDFPLNPGRDRAWMSGEADARVRKWASSDGSGTKDTIDWAKYASTHFWRDDSNKTNFTGYKLGFVDIVDGKPYAIWHGVAAAAAVMQGSRGGVEIPEADRAGVKRKIEAYYAKARSEFNDDSIRVPWEEAGAGRARTTAVQTRRLSLQVERSAGMAPDGAIPVCISSDAVVEMPDGPEMLVHTPDAVDLSRAPLPIIATHKGGQVNVGIVDGIQIANGRMRGMARFGTRPEAAGYREDVANGIIRSVSVGYERKDGYVRKDRTLVTTRWMPMHTALVAEPADVNAGFFRSAAHSADQANGSATAVRDAEGRHPAAFAATTKGVAMSDATTATAAGNAEGNTSITMGNDGAAQERLRIGTIDALCRRNYGRYKPTDDDRAKWINEGRSADEVSNIILEQIATRAQATVQDSPASVGLSDSEVKRYSVAKAIRACVEKSWPKVAPFEAEVSQAIGRKLGKASGEFNFYVPLEVQMGGQQFGRQQQRDVMVGTSTLGGYLVGTQVMGFVDLLRNRSVVMRLGATMLPGLSGSVAIPKLTGASTAYWFANEAGTATESTPTFGQLTLTPKTVGGYVEVSRQLMLQTAYNADAIINGDLARVIGLAVDTAALAGPGTAGQPTGIVSASGVGTANPTAGTAVVYADMIRFQSTVAGSNAMMPGFAYVTTPAVAGILMGKSRFTNSDTPIWQGNILDGQVVGAPAMTSLQVGSGSMLAGDFSNVVIGEWGVLEVEANPYAQFQAGIIGVRALYTVDVGVRYGAAFALGTGMTG